MKHAIIIAAAIGATVATPAAAQQVVELPSLSAMIEQSQNRAATQAVPATPKARKAQERDYAGEDRAQEKANKAAAKLKAAEERLAEKKLERAEEMKLKREKMWLKEARKMGEKRRKYKPLKNVRILPPNAKAY